MQWGDAAEWFSAIGTFVALMFAAVAARAARAAYRIESERDRVNAEERQRHEAFLRRGQAALVSAWWGSRSDTWGAFVRNASETPVYRVRVSVVSPRDPDVHEAIDLAVVPPAAEPLFYPTGIRVDSTEVPVELDRRVEVAFSDSTGIRWIRDQQGGLAEVLSELTIWADDQRTTTLDQFTADFLASHHVVVRFRTRPIETLREDFLAAGRSGEGADILVGPHDWIGDLARHAAIDPIRIDDVRKDAFTRYAMEAMLHDDKVYGIPYAADAICLLRNLDLAPDQPRTVEELIAHGRELCVAGRASLPVALQVGGGDCFYVYPWFTSAGGRLIAETGGAWDTVAMTGPGSTAAFARLAALGRPAERVLTTELDRDGAVSAFNQGRTPYLVCAAYGVGEARAAGIPVGVSRMPPFADGSTARSLVAVHGFFLGATGRNKTIAQDLIIDYLTRREVALALYAAQPRTPALRTAVLSTSDSEATPFHEACEAGDLIPSTPDSPAIFAAFHRAEVAAITGTDVAVVMRALTQSVRQAVR